MKLTSMQRWAILGTALALTLAAIKWAGSNQDLEVKPAQSPHASAAAGPSHEGRSGSSKARPRMPIWLQKVR